MKRILLYILFSITIFSEPILLKNENQLTDSSQKISVIEYEKLKWKFEQLEKEIRELKESSINNNEILSDVTQKYADVSLYLKESTGDVKSLYKESFNDLKTLIYQFLALVIAVLIGIKVIGTWELNKKFEEIEKIKEALKKLEDDVKTKYEQLDKKTAEDLEKIRSEVEFKRENINELSGEIKNTLNAEKENIIDEIKAKILITSDWGGGKTENMFSSYDKSKKIDEEESKEMKLDHYKNLVNSQNYDEAVLGYENIIKNSKDKDELYEAYKDLGNIYQKLDRYEESIINYKKALQFMKNKNIESKIDLYKEISYILKRMSRYNESLTYLEIAYELNPNLFKKCELEVLFELYNRSNNKEKSLEILNKIKNNETKESEIYRIDKKIASLYCHHKEYKTALILYKKLLEKAKKNYKNDLPLLYFYLGLIYFNLKDYKNSRENFEEIDNNNDLYKTGQIYIKIIEEKAD